MTTGSWTVGNLSTGPFWAAKVWNGGDGKYESWGGGTRTKWNNYVVTHRRMTCNLTEDPGRDVVPLGGFTMNQIKSLVGWSNNDELRMLNQLAETIRGHSFDLGINIAEAKKSYSTIRENLLSVGSALWHLKHGRLAQASRVLSRGKRSQGILAKRLSAKDLSGRWLETQYAFRPLIDQAYEAAKALEAVTGPRVLRFTAKSQTKRKSYNDSASPTVYTSDAHWSYQQRITAELSEDLSLQRSLGLLDPASIAWEVVPYSFVVDWFIPVGSYLSALAVIPHLQGRFLRSERGVGRRGAITAPPGANPGNPDAPWRVFAATNRREVYTRATRTSSTSLSVPRPRFNKLPRALSPKRLLNAVALIHQRLR